MPSIDMSETEQAYEIKAELPGIEPKDIELTLKDDLLTLKGEKRAEREEKRKNYYLQERSRGAFHRVLRLPDDVEPERITTHYADGVLTVTLPKSEQARSRIRRIEIQS
ncbi:MAG: Hsp20/alpha crystallin family protein [Candidatus Competibacterales bacterium]|nr:Hsp20/alpha crystallin family protein [Candidatus Competibacterales bacterium]